MDILCKINVTFYAIQKHLGMCKKVQGQSEATLQKQAGVTKSFDIS